MASKSIILSLRKPQTVFLYRDVLFPRQIVPIQQVNCLHSGCQLEKQQSKDANYYQYDGGRRELSKLTIADAKPALRKVEKITFVVLAKAKNGFFIVKDSNEFRIVKESFFKTLVWAKDSFTKHILNNSTVQSKVKVFKDKLEDASQEIALKKRK